MALAAKESAEPTFESIREYSSSAGLPLRVDRETNTIHGCKILGLQSRNRAPRNFAYPAENHSKYVKVLEGVVSNIGHRKDGEVASYANRIGQFKNVTPTPNGTIGDYIVNPHHALAEQLFWDAEHAPEKVCFSILGGGKINRKDPKHPFVEELADIESIDLVGAGGTTRTLYESADELPEGSPERELCEHGLSALSDARLILEGTDAIETKTARLKEVLTVWSAELAGHTQPVQETSKMGVEWKDITKESLTENRKDLVEVLTGTDATSKLAAQVTTLTESLAAKEAELATAKTGLATIEAEKAKLAKAAAIQEELKEGKLDTNDKEVVTPALMEALDILPDAPARKRLIEATAKLAKGRAGAGGAPPFAPVGGETTTKTTEERVKGWR